MTKKQDKFDTYLLILLCTGILLLLPCCAAEAPAEPDAYTLDAYKRGLVDGVAIGQRHCVAAIEADIVEPPVVIPEPKKAPKVKPAKRTFNRQESPLKIDFESDDPLVGIE